MNSADARSSTQFVGRGGADLAGAPLVVEGNTYRFDAPDMGDYVTCRSADYRRGHCNQLVLIHRHVIPDKCGFGHSMPKVQHGRHEPDRT